MQITIVQSEIEQAIRDYVGSQLRVAEGMEMSIDLSATRGAEGFKATIDINPIAAPAAVTKAAAPAPVAVARVAPVANQALVEAAKETEALNNESEVPFDTPETPAEEAAEAAAQPVEAASNDDEQEAPAPTRSLFKGLSKPKNS